MKLLKSLLIIFTIFTFSSCFFLDYVIPEEYFEEDEISNNYIQDEVIYSEYVWIIFRPDKKHKNYTSLNHAVNSLRYLDVIVYKSKTYDIAQQYDNSNHNKRRVSYAALIKSIDLKKIKKTNWQYYHNGKLE